MGRMPFFGYNIRILDTQTTTTEQPILRWSALTHPDHVRTKFWYAGALTVLALLLAYSIFTRAWTFTLVLVLLAVIYGIYHRKNPPLTIGIFENGIQWKRERIRWSEMNGFWMLQGPGYVELHLDIKNPWRNNIIIQTGDIDPHQIFEILSQYLKHFPEKQERLFDTIIRICKL